MHSGTYAFVYVHLAGQLLQSRQGTCAVLLPQGLSAVCEQRYWPLRLGPGSSAPKSVARSARSPVSCSHRSVTAAKVGANWRSPTGWSAAAAGMPCVWRVDTRALPLASKRPTGRRKRWPAAMNRTGHRVRQISSHTKTKRVAMSSSSVPPVGIACRVTARAAGLPIESEPVRAMKRARAT